MLYETWYNLMHISNRPLIQGYTVVLTHITYIEKYKSKPFSVFREASEIKQEIFTVVCILTLQFDHLHVHDGWSLTAH